MRTPPPPAPSARGFLGRTNGPAGLITPRRRRGAAIRPRGGEPSAHRRGGRWSVRLVAYVLPTPGGRVFSMLTPLAFIEVRRLVRRRTSHAARPAASASSGRGDTGLNSAALASPASRAVGARRSWYRHAPSATPAASRWYARSPRAYAASEPARCCRPTSPLPARCSIAMCAVSTRRRVRSLLRAELRPESWPM